MRRVVASTSGVPSLALAADAEGPATASSEGTGPDPLRTEFDFELPRGYLDRHGALHKRGRMRLATARDELLPLIDDRVRKNSAYMSVVLLGRVVTSLGTLRGDDISGDVIEELFASDLAFLQDLYRRINTEGHTRAAVTCPACQERFAVDLAGGPPGES